MNYNKFKIPLYRWEVVRGEGSEEVERKLHVKKQQHLAHCELHPVRVEILRFV
jgi:hypothetical protein